jgi:hypothetical protein
LGRGFLYGGGEVFEAEEKLEERDCELADAHRRLKVAQQRAEAAEASAKELERVYWRLRQSLAFYLMANHGTVWLGTPVADVPLDVRLTWAVLGVLDGCDVLALKGGEGYDGE